MLYVQMLASKDKSKIFTDAQARGLLLCVFAISLCLALYLIANKDYDIWPAITQASFNVISIVTTTGYASTDYTVWGPLVVALFFCITFVGGCSGSTAGGMKIFRFQLSLIMLKNQLTRLLHPHVVLRPKYNGRHIDADIITSAIAFSFLFFISLTVIALILASMGLDFVTSISGAATVLANVGPGLGDTIGPAGNFHALPDAAKWVLCCGMLLGRLEFVAVIIIFTPAFWRA